MNLPVSMHAVAIDRDNGFGLKDAQVPLSAVGEQNVQHALALLESGQTIGKLTFPNL